MIDADRPLHPYADELITFDSVAAARDPEMRKQLLEMAIADKNPNALKHALNVVEQAMKQPTRQ